MVNAVTRAGVHRSAEKLQRWMDLLAALLGHHYPITLEDLVREVPGYARPGLSKATLRRAFERDKAELRALGMPIETITLDDGESAAYRLGLQQFYLPYLVLAARGIPHDPAQGQPTARLRSGAQTQPTKPRRVDRYGYRALPTLLFEPEELRYVFTAGHRLEGLGDATLAEAARSAIRKLQFDLPVGAVSAFTEQIVPPRARLRSGVLTALWQALATRTGILIAYHSMGSNVRAQRRVEPYGLFLNGGHWYLVARDVERSARRTFRVSRISAVRAKARSAATPDYDIPADFALCEHARSRQVWEIGDGDAVEAVVEFDGDAGTVTAAARLGATVKGWPKRRRFEVRRIDAFARWLLSFGGDARPVSPESLCRQYADIAKRTLELYTADAAPVISLTENEGTIGDPGTPRDSTIVAETTPAFRETEDPVKGDTAAQLRRILAALPELGVDGGLCLHELSDRVGTDAGTLLRDLQTLTARGGMPAGFVEGIQVYFEHDRITALAPQFLRPTRLTAVELCTLELGLAMLRRESPPEEQPWIDRARVRLRGAIVTLSPELLAELAAAPHARMEASELGVVTPHDRAHLAALRSALDGRRKLRLLYRAGSAGALERIVRPYKMLFDSGSWHLVAFCEARLAVRQFRLDRVDEAEVLSESYEIPAVDAQAGEIYPSRSDARPLAIDQPTKNAESLRVWYSAQIARWIAEREGKQLAADGSLTLSHPLADRGWAVRHVLQYGPDAELLKPAALRRELVGRLDGILRERNG